MEISASPLKMRMQTFLIEITVTVTHHSMLRSSKHPSLKGAFSLYIHMYVYELCDHICTYTYIQHPPPRENQYTNRSEKISAKTVKVKSSFSIFLVKSYLRSHQQLH